MTVLIVWLAAAFVGASVTRTLSVTDIDGEIDWFDAAVWSPPGVPSEFDDVKIENLWCGGSAGTYLQFTIPANVTRPYTIKSLEIVSANFLACRTVVLIGPSESLLVSNHVTIDSFDAFVGINPGASVVVGGDFLVNAGTLQGTGTISARKFTMNGLNSNLCAGFTLGQVCKLCLGGPLEESFGSLHISTVQGSFFVGSNMWFKVEDSEHDYVQFAGGLSLINNVSITPISLTSAASYPSILFDRALGPLSFVSPPIVRPGGSHVENRYTVAVSGVGFSYDWTSCDRRDLCFSNPPSDPTGSGGGGTTIGTCSNPGTLSITVGFDECPISADPPLLETCTPTTCANDGTCSNVAGVSCSCVIQNGFGWDGDRCDVPLCLNRCGGIAHGTCVGASVSFCDCAVPWSGTACQDVVCSPPCSVNGTCIASGGASMCECAVGFDGLICDQALISDVCSSVCAVHGTCNTSVTPARCDCQEHYTGTSCSTPICPVGVLSSRECSGNGVCLGGGTPFCNCSLGFNGTACETAICPTVSFGCQNEGTCYINSLAEQRCSCLAGFTGSFCQVRSESSTGQGTAVVGIAVGVSVGVVLLGVAIVLVIYGISKYRARRYTRQVNASLKENHMALVAEEL